MPQTFNVGSRSLFVSVTAWVFIVLGAAASLSTLMQNAALISLLPGFAPAFEPRALPPLTGLLVAHLQWVAGVGLVLSVATLAAAIGLLLRQEWARRVFIVLAAVAIVGNLLGLWLQQELLQNLIDTTLSRSALPREALGVFGGFATAARVAAILASLAACGVLAWIIGRLRSAIVRQEFA
jgi:type II secretory pathway component PulF